MHFITRTPYGLRCPTGQLPSHSLIKGKRNPARGSAPGEAVGAAERGAQEEAALELPCPSFECAIEHNVVAAAADDEDMSLSLWVVVALDGAEELLGGDGGEDMLTTNELAGLALQGGE